MSRCIIYGLIDPRTRLIRYVGLSSEGLRRPARHRQPLSLRDRNYKNAWLHLLFAAGLDYEIVVLEEVASKDALAYTERFWIAYGRSCGWPLTNLTDGGDGWSGRRHSADARARLRAASLGRRQSPETVAKRVAKNRGQKRSPETRAKMSAWQIGKKLSLETRAKISAARRGRA